MKRQKAAGANNKLQEGKTTMRNLINETVLMTVLLAMTGAGILIKICSWVLYKKLEAASCHMGDNKNSLTRQLKMKFENCYKLNLDIKNIPAFVEKYVQNYRIMGISPAFLQKNAPVCAILMGMVCIGGSFLQYVNSYDLKIVLRTLLFGILGELLLLLAEIVFDTRRMPDRISINLEEYLANVLSRRLELEYEDAEPAPAPDAAGGFEAGQMQTAATKVRLKKSRKDAGKANEEEQIIREIIKEFLC